MSLTSLSGRNPGRQDFLRHRLSPPGLAGLTNATAYLNAGYAPGSAQAEDDSLAAPFELRSLGDVAPGVMYRY